MCERLLANPLIEDYEIVRSERLRLRRRPLPRLVRRAWTPCSPAERVGDAEILWHGDRDLNGVDAVVVPGGFSYGDYLRVGRDRALLAGDGGRWPSSPREGGPGARHLQRLPGPLRGGAAARARCCPTPRCASSAARSTSWSRTRTTPFTRACAEGDGCRSRSSTRPAASTRRPSCSTRARAGRAPLRAGPQPQRLARRHRRRRATRRATSFGLMPHPEHAVDPLTGSGDGAAALRVGPRACLRGRPRVTLGSRAATASSASPTPSSTLICEQLGRDPNEVELAVFSLHVVASTAPTSTRKKLLRRAADRGPHVLMGPGENAGAVDVGDGLAVAFKVESHNHPSAVEPFQGAATGVGGHPARHLRRGRAADRRARLAALRRARVAALALPARPGRRRHRPLRQLDRRPHGRRRDLLRARLRAELPRQRDVPRARRARAADPRAGGGPGNVLVLLRRAHRPRRDRRRVGARLAPSCRRTDDGQAPDACRSATRSRRRSWSSAASSCSSATCSRRSRTSARPG